MKSKIVYVLAGIILVVVIVGGIYFLISKKSGGAANNNITASSSGNEAMLSAVEMPRKDSLRSRKPASGHRKGMISVRGWYSKHRQSMSIDCLVS